MSELENKVVDSDGAVNVVDISVPTNSHLHPAVKDVTIIEDDVASVKQKSERLLKLITAVGAIMLIAILGLSAVVISLVHTLSDLKASVAVLDEETRYNTADHQKQLDTLSGSIESVRDDMEAGFDDQQAQLNTIKDVQHNTNNALNRLRKQKEQLEKDLKEGLQLRKQRMEEAARAYSNSSNFFASAGDYAQGLADGVFELTAYAWTGNTCANGEYPVVGYSCASNYYPLGTRLYIEGIGERVVTDTGGMSSNVVDVYMGDEETCIQFGRQTANVYVIEE